MRKLTAGQAITAGQLVEFRSGLVYPVSNATEAAVSSTGQITTSTINLSPNGARRTNGGELFVRNPADGSLYFFGYSTTGDTYTLSLSRITLGSTTVSSVTIDSYSSPAFTVSAVPIYIGFLSNGNILSVWNYQDTALANAFGARFAIHTQTLTSVVGATTVSNWSSSGINLDWTGATVLTQNGNSGFVVSFPRDVVSPVQMRMIRYNNSGVAQTSAIPLYTYASVAGSAYVTLAELSNGNVVQAMNASSSSSPTGMILGIFNPATGSVVVPFANITPSASTPLPVRIATVTGAFALNYLVSTNSLRFDLFSNDGTRQGSQSTISVTSGQQGTINYQTTNLFSDGTTFYLYRGGVDQILRAISSTNVTLRTVTLSSTMTNMGWVIDNGIIHGYGQTAYAPTALEQHVAIRASDFSIIIAATTYGSSGTYVQVEPTLSYVASGVIATYFWNGTSQITFRRIKVESTTVQGIAWTNASVGNSVLIRDAEPGTYKLSSAVTGTSFPITLTGAYVNGLRGCIGVVNDSTTLLISPQTRPLG
jgi:hypothetical protein